MVQPRVRSLGRLQRSAVDVSQRLAGMAQRGRVEDVDILRGTAKVLMYGRNGQTAMVEGVRVTGYEPISADLKGREVVMLVPTGRVTDGVWIAGTVAQATP